MTKIDLSGAEFSPRAENLEAWKYVNHMINAVSFVRAGSYNLWVGKLPPAPGVYHAPSKQKMQLDVNVSPSAIITSLRLALT